MSSQSMIAKRNEQIAALRKAVEDAQARGESQEQIITTLVDVCKSIPSGLDVLIATYRDAVQKNRTDFAAAIEDRLIKSREQGNLQGGRIGSFTFDSVEVPVEKDGKLKSKLNDGLTDSERAHAARIRRGQS